ncbi:hypothetical protein AMS68_004692 [Peltaster fructicola]|uniref:Helicase ATP-binding domain-containing protein n=1 Tax=Peltaster fructicola TaxID=286661 RepID=A0A6H0XWY9_9PEZI|nr:hypothetical protein AMS68_004692 [Peltaster fructicola]
MDTNPLFLPQVSEGDEQPIEEYDLGAARADVLQIQHNLLHRMAAPLENRGHVDEHEVEDVDGPDVELSLEQLEQEVLLERAAAEARRQKRKLQHEAMLEQSDDDDDPYESIDDELPAPPAPSRSKRGRQTEDDEPARKKPRKAAPKKPAAKRGRKNAEVDQLTNTNSIHKIMRTNVFEDAQLTANLPAQPTLAVGKNKSAALKSLLQSIPAKDKEAARSDTIKLDNASKVIGARKVKYGSEEGFLLNGMKTPLKHYQVLGLAFMRDRENNERRPRGGILADGMGLGKTVEALANIVNGKQLQKGMPKATLIVVPPNLMAQWLAETKKHVYTEEEVIKRDAIFGQESNEQRLSAKHGLKAVAIFKDVQKMKNLVAFLQKQDVVFATYPAVLKSYPPMNPPKELHTSQQKNEWYEKHFFEKAGPLHQIKWHRIILDEAHLIKNHLSNTSMACRALRARHYWALTGTPVQNELAEFYSYFRFIRDPYVMSFRMFKANFCNEDDPAASQKLLAMLDRVMLRRTHADTMFGAKLLDIPRPEAPTTMYINFNVTERMIYEFIKRKYCSTIKQMARSGPLERRKIQRHLHSVASPSAGYRPYPAASRRPLRYA